MKVATFSVFNMASSVCFRLLLLCCVLLFQLATLAMPKAATSSTPTAPVNPAPHTPPASAPEQNRPAISLPANLIRLPLTRQARSFTCGVSALQSVLAYYGEEIREDDLAKKLKSNYSEGTAYRNIAKYAESRGFHVDIHKDMTLADLKGIIDRKLPVIVLLQAWAGRPIDYRDAWTEGHYVVATGYDTKNIYFMDPSTLGNFAYIPEAEFVDRWHDTDGKEKLTHFGMVVTKDKPSYQPDVATFME